MKKIFFFPLINTKIKNNNLLIILLNINNDKSFVRPINLYYYFYF